MISWLFYIIGLFLTLCVIVKIYIKSTTGWCRSHTCLRGKTAIITGANTGIGYYTALDFAKRGARVILACRDEDRAEDARYNIVKETGNGNVVVKLIDLSSFESVRAFAKDINDNEERLDILVNNAGAAGIGDKRSKDGHVLLMQINYFSSFLLTNLLIDLMKKNRGGRIVNVSSVAAKWATEFDVDKIDTFPGIYRIYNDTKLCNILFTLELARRLEGTGITTYSLHPGAVNTEIFRHAHGFLGLVFDLARKIFKTSEEGAQTTIHCAVAKGLEDYNGEHFDECKRVKPYETVKVPGLSKKLWEVTLAIVDQ